MRYAAVALLVVGLLGIKACGEGEAAEETPRVSTIAPARGARPISRATRSVAPTAVAAPIASAALRRWEAEASAGAARLDLAARKSLPISVTVAPTCSAGFLDHAADVLESADAGVVLEVEPIVCEGRTTLARAFLPRDIKARPLRLSFPAAPSAKPCVVRISLSSGTVVASRVAWIDATSFVLLEDQAAYRSHAALASALEPLLGDAVARKAAASTPQTNHNLNASLSSAGVALTIGAYHAGDCRPRTKGKP